MDVRTRLEHAHGAAYSIDRELTGGAMSHVYVAEERAFGRQVVVKVLREDLTEGASAARFKREISVAAKLQHPHIVPLLSAGEEGGTLFYTMPYVEGESLRTRLDREGELPIPDVVRVLREVASALAYAHRRAIVHRDIKPENILLSDGNALVTDFGIAKALEIARTLGDQSSSTITQLGVAIGTPAYMAPEQGAADPTVDHRADLYALGCVAYEMLSGRPPFEGRATRQLLAAHATEAPAPIGARRTSAPAQLTALVMQCLEKSPADRPQSAAEVLRTLETLASERSGATTPVELASARHASGSRVRIMLVVSALVAVGVAAGVLVAHSRNATNSALASYDVGLSPDAPIAFRGWSALSIAPRGDFVVYVAETEGGMTQLRYRGLRDTIERLIPGTDRGYGPQISPDGRSIAFIRTASNAEGRTPYRLEITEVDGSQPRSLADLRDPIAIRWISPSRFVVFDDDGLTLRWFDPQSGEAGKSTTLDRNCNAPSLLDAGQALLCTRMLPKFGAVVVPGVDGQRLLRWRAGNAASSPQPVVGSYFRVVDGTYVVYLSVDGELRAARLDRQSFEIGRPVTLVSGIRREPTAGVGQYDIASNGTLTYVPGDNAAVGRLMIVHPRSSAPQPVPLLAEPAAFLLFSLSPDERRLAVVVQVRDGQELRIHDLADGRSQTWLRAPIVGGVGPVWSPRGDRLAVWMRNDSTSALVVGSPDAAASPDTLVAGTASNPAPPPSRWLSDSVLLLISRGTVLSFDPRSGGRVLDTVAHANFPGVFPVVSPNRRFFLSRSPGGGTTITPIPAGDRVSRIPGASEAMWVSATTVRYQLEGGVGLYEVSVDSVTGQVRGVPRPYFSDPRMVHPPGLSHRPVSNDGMMYVQGPARTTATYLRVIPNWVAKMKQIVDSADASAK